MPRDEETGVDVRKGLDMKCREVLQRGCQREVQLGSSFVHNSPRPSPARAALSDRKAKDRTRKPAALAVSRQRAPRFVPAWYSDGQRDTDSKHNSIPLRTPQVGALAGCVVRCVCHWKGAAKHTPEDESRTGAAGDLGTATRNLQPSAPTCLEGPRQAGAILTCDLSRRAGTIVAASTRVLSRGKGKR